MYVPLPEDDDLSDEEFEGYLNEGDSDDGDIDDNGGSDDDMGDRNGVNGDGDNGIPEFVGHPGCTQDMTNKAPIDFLQLFITDEILDGIVEQTNLFAQ